MSKFVRHESCPSCGSRDNLARYSDGSAFCFGCRYVERGTTSPFVKERDGKDEEPTDRVGFPRDSTDIIDHRGLEWLSSFGLSTRDASTASFKWSPYWQQLLIPVFEEGRSEPCCIQAKNFDPERASKAKYYNVGDKSNHFTIYGGRRSNLIVLTEDVLSSLKIAPISDAMPLLGVHIARDKLMRLKRLYSSLVVWLDEDKWKEAREIADAAKLIGFKATTLLTPDDPKCYSIDDLSTFLSRATGR